MQDDDTAVDGSLSVEMIDGNAMLKFTDNSTTAENLDTAVQKIRVSVGQLLRPDQLESVYRISFDLYAEAKDELFLSDDGEYRRVPGWIGGGGGTMCADGNWYSFADFSASGINEYDLERSDACHVEFKFLLAESGKKWDSTVEDVNFSVMRWGMQNLSDFYLDNITFYDQEGNPIPLNLSETEGSFQTPNVFKKVKKKFRHRNRGAFMKKLFPLLVICAVLLTGCGFAGENYRNYVTAILDCTYHNESSSYRELTNASELWMPMSFMTNELRYAESEIYDIYGIKSDKISEETKKAYEELAEISSQKDKIQRSGCYARK